MHGVRVALTVVSCAAIGEASQLGAGLLYLIVVAVIAVTLLLWTVIRLFRFVITTPDEVPMSRLVRLINTIMRFFRPGGPTGRGR
jgi:hypothetical protein